MAVDQNCIRADTSQGKQIVDASPVGFPDRQLDLPALRHV